MSIKNPRVYTAKQFFDFVLTDGTKYAKQSCSNKDVHSHNRSTPKRFGLYLVFTVTKSKIKKNEVNTLKVP